MAIRDGYYTFVKSLSTLPELIVRVEYIRYIGANSWDGIKEIKYDSVSDMFIELNSGEGYEFDSDEWCLRGVIKRYLIDNDLVKLDRYVFQPTGIDISLRSEYRRYTRFHDFDPLTHMFPCGSGYIDLSYATVLPTEKLLSQVKPQKITLWQKLKSFLSNKEQ